VVDYLAATGSGGQMMIRDTGGAVEFWVKSGSSSTVIYAPGADWSATAASGKFTYPTGAPWVRVGSINVSTSQTISFSIGNTGTSGLGGPTNMSAFINRGPGATLPGQIVGQWASNIQLNSFDINFGAPASDGGSQIDFYLVRISKNNPPDIAPYTDKATQTGTANSFTGLEAGTEYFVTVYAHNAIGYSILAPPISVRTLGGSRFKLGGVYRFGIPYVKVGGIYKIVAPYVKVSGTYRRSL
jgi:hypothetical protein